MDNTSEPELSRRKPPKSDTYQHHIDVHIVPPLSTRWLSAWWRIDILTSFPTAPGQLKKLIMVVDYFVKWVEVEPLA